MENRDKSIVEFLKQELEANWLTCILYKDGICFTHVDRGVKPMIDFASRDYMEGAIVVDKVIGKASAMFLAKEKVEHVHGLLVSKLAIEVLEKNGIEFSAEETVERIVNRTGDGLCPLESSVEYIDDLDDGIEAVYEKIKELMKGRN